MIIQKDLHEISTAKYEKWLNSKCLNLHIGYTKRLRLNGNFIRYFKKLQKIMQTINI